MKPTKSLTIAATVALLACTPAWALSGGAATNSDAHGGNPHASLPGPSASLPAKAKAYGVYCAKESRKHVAGQKGTPYSLCVSGAAKLQNDQQS